MRKVIEKYATVVTIVFAVVFFVVIGSQIISKQIEKKIRSSQLASFSLTVDRVSVNLFSGQIHLSDVELQDSVNDGTILIPEINVKGLNIFSLIFLGEINLKEIQLQNADIRLAKNALSTSARMQKGSGPKRVKNIHIERLKIEDASILISDENTEYKDSLISVILNIEISSLTTSSQRRNYRFENTGFQEVVFSLSDGKCFFSDDLYNLNFDSAHYLSTIGEFNVTGLGIKTNFSKYAVARQTNVETDWFDIGIPEFVMDGVQLNDLLASQNLIFDKVEIDSPKIHAFRDKRWPFPQKPDTKLPMEMFAGLPFKIHSKMIAVKNGDASYQERVKDSEQAGLVRFDNLELALKNLSTIDSLISEPTTMNASALVMGQGVLNVDFTFPNPVYDDAYSAKGKLASMPLKAFNPMLTQNAFVNVEQGSLQQIAFDFQYGNDESNGDLVFEYEGLKLQFLDHENGSEKKIKSFIANTFVVDKQNISGENSFKKGTIHFERNKKKSIFNYWWKSILSGIKSIAIF